MSTYDYILFDLDGTLTDPKEGITKSVQYALDKMGIHESDLDEPDKFIGPPLMESFQSFYGLSEVEARQGIDFYRERFKQTGMFENVLYQGIVPLLEHLVGVGKKLCVATSKPTVFSEQILKYFKIEGFFDEVVGSHLDGTRSSKAEIIQEVLNRVKAPSLRDIVMVGDRKHDVIGAQNTGISSIGVTYGYGSYEELTDAKATYIVNSVSSLQALLSKVNELSNSLNLPKVY